jgi:hypothetical protein
MAAEQGQNAVGRCFQCLDFSQVNFLIVPIRNLVRSPQETAALIPARSDPG